MKIGIIREGKVPPDKRVPLTPEQCAEIRQQFPEVELFVQPSPIRTFTDAEYAAKGLPLQEDLSHCDVLLGVKEVPYDMLIPHKTYCFFSHTTKEQPYNRKLLQTVLAKKIRLIDWEHLTNEHHVRVIAFGRYAGIVGAYNGILTYGKKYDLFHLKPANQCFDMAEMKTQYAHVQLPPVKIVLTGGGRVSRGAMEVLDGMGIKKVSVDEYLQQSFSEAVYCQLDTEDYNMKPDGSFNKEEFYNQPQDYVSNFARFAAVSDMLIAGAFWDPEAPVLFTLKDTQSSNFKIRVIADITMDIDGSIPTTLRPATIAEPWYDFDPATGELKAPFSSPAHITEMAVDNLPCELPRDASRDFGKEFVRNVLPNLIGPDPHNMIGHATITTFEGTLADEYNYLSDYVAGN